MKFYKLGNYMLENTACLPGVQLYSVKEDFQNDPFDTLNRIAKIGYKIVEFYDYAGIPAREMKRKLDELDLITVSTHVSVENLETSLNELLDYASIIGARYIVISNIPKETLMDSAKYAALITSFERLYKEITKRGFKMVLHTHGHWFEKANAKQTYLDRLLSDLRFKLLLEIDTYWVKQGGSNPETILLKYEGRVPLVHLKDIDQQERTAPVGSGLIDFQKIVSQFQDACVRFFFVEQEDFEPRTTPFKDIEKSLKYLKSIGAVC